ncbi:MAG: FMN-dependent NADH-azoreductase [Candidatus Obscuribacterales bacterium]|nr:FMN-dependent NADH-azoreductase [Candidatus Obscuribacterales bacterium]
MAKLLHIDSSGKGSQSVTRPLTKYFADQWQQSNQGGQVIYRDLLQSNLPFVNEEMVAAFFTPPDKHTAQQKEILSISDSLVDELLAADTYVFGAPMYNFTVPAVMKAYIDLVVRAGKTFVFEGHMPKGLLQNKKAVIISSSGGDYSAPPMKSYDMVDSYLRAILGFLGVTDVTYLTAPGRNPETIAASSGAVEEKIREMLQAATVR